MRALARNPAICRAGICLLGLASVFSGSLGAPTAEEEGERAPRTPIEELDILWERLRTAPVNPEYGQLIERTKSSIRTVGRLGPAGQRVLHDYLRGPDPTALDTNASRSAYREAKVTIIEVLAETRFNEAVPTLIEIVAAVEPAARQRGASLSGELRFWYCREIAGAAVPALGILGDASAVPALRAAFDLPWEWHSHGEALFNRIPRALVALGDEDYLAQYLLRHLEGDNPREAFYAAHLAQYIRAPLMTPQLIAYFARTNDPAARWALQSTTGQYYVDVKSWNEWWAGAAGLPPSDWTSLDPTPSRQRRWAAAVTSMIDEELLRCGPLKWWQPDYVGYGNWRAASLHLAEVALALAITEPVSEHLRARLGDETCTSCVRTSCVACPIQFASQRRTGGAGADAADPQVPEIPRIFEVPIRTNAAKLLAAISCVVDGSCGKWDEWTALEGITGVTLEMNSCAQRRMAAQKAARGDVEVTATVRPTVEPADGTNRTFVGGKSAVAGAVTQLRLAKEGSDILLTWQPAAYAVHYHIQRADEPQSAATTAFAQVENLTRFIDPWALFGEEPLFYIVRGSTAAGEMGP